MNHGPAYWAPKALQYAAERDAALARVAELEDELAAAESTIRVLENPELREGLSDEPRW